MLRSTYFHYSNKRTINMSVTFQRPQITRVDRAPPTNVGGSLMQAHSKSIPPFAAALRTISHANHKPHVMPIRQDFVRNSGGNNRPSAVGPIVLPKLGGTPSGRNRSMTIGTSKTDLLSPVRQHGGSLSVRNHRGPA